MDNVETTPLDMVEKPTTLTVVQAVEEIIRKSNLIDGLAIGIKEALRSIENSEAYLCVMAENCDKNEYKKLVEAMCSSHKIDLVVVPDKKILGLWAGLDTKTMNLKKRKKHNCSCLVVKMYSEESEAIHLVLKEFEKLEDGKKIIKIKAEEKEPTEGKKGGKKKKK